MLSSCAALLVEFENHIDTVGKRIEASSFFEAKKWIEAPNLLKAEPLVEVLRTPVPSENHIRAYW